MKRAVLIGIDEYDHLKPLHGCVNDVAALLPLLMFNGERDEPSKNFECETYTSGSGYVGRPELRRAIEVALQPGVAFSLLYFAGHGIPEQNDVVLVSQDGKAGDYGVPLTDVLTRVQQSPVNEILIILDCCYSGGGGVPQLGSNNAVLRHGFSLLTASRGDQAAAELGRGLFSQQLCDALAGGAADVLGHVTLAGIYGYLSESFGAFDQRPTFRANVDKLTDIRLCEPAITVTDARQLPKIFAQADGELLLDPTFEPTAKVKKKNLANQAVFAILQRCRAARLVEPVGTPHMWNAAMGGKPCRLTPLGKHYWRRAKYNRL
jgi:hypothetical protein